MFCASVFLSRHKLKLLLSLLSLIVILLLCPIFKSSFKIKTSSLVVAITQIAPHPSLDKIRQGIEDCLTPEQLAKHNLKPVEIVFQNAQGNLALAAQIATRFVSLKPFVVVPITTPSAQSILSVAKGKNIRIIFAGVSDPKAAKLSSSVEVPLLTGVSDKAPIGEQAKLMREIMPSLQKIGIVYNPSEINSAQMVELMKEILGKVGVVTVLAPAHNVQEIISAVQSLKGKVEAIYLPNDNTLISSLSSVLKVTRQLKIPVFSSDPESVEKGCLASIAPDQYKMGQQVGRLVVEALKGTDLKDLPIELARESKLVINVGVAKELGINLTPELLKRADYTIQPSL